MTAALASRRMRCQGRLSLLVACAVFISVDAGLLPIEQSFVATDPSHLGSVGKRFAIGFMRNIFVTSESRVLLLVTTTESEPVTFSVRTKSSRTLHTATFGVSTQLAIPAEFLYVTDGGQRDRYIMVQTEDDKTISVYGINDEQHTTDGFVALSCDGMQLGVPFRRYEYVIVSAEIEPSSSTVLTFSQFLIIPCENDTEIEIVPSQMISAIASDLSSLTFGPGQSRTSARWEERSGKRPTAGSTLLIAHTSDLTGTIIRSSKPIAVFSGHQCAQVPAGSTACDHLVEQIPPQTTWGYTFLLNPLGARESGDLYRVATVYDNTEVTVTCVDEGDDAADTKILETLNRAPGQNWLEYSTSAPNSAPCIEVFIRKFCTLQSTNPVLVAQYSQGYTVDTECTGDFAGDLGDPFMMIVPPIVQYINSYVITSFTALAGIFHTRFVGISVYKDFFDPESIMMDDAVIEPDYDKWNKIYCSVGEVCGYGLYREIELGDHRIYHIDENAGINVQSYGFQQENSYGFPAGMEMEQLSGTIVQCQELYEVQEGPELVTVTCTRSLDLSVQSFIRITSQDGSAVGAMDYVPIDFTFRYRGGNRRETEVLFPMVILDDGIDESTEEFFFNVVAVENVIVLTPLITVRIRGDGGCLQLPPIDNGAVELSGRTVGSSATYSCSEGFVLVGDETRVCQNTGLWSLTEPICREQISISINIIDSQVQESDGTVLVEVVLSSPSTEDIVVTLQPVSNSATAGTDFEGQVIQVVIPASETNVPVRVPIINDNLVEPSQEVFSIVLQLSGSDGGLTTVGTGVGTVDIMDDDIVIGFEETSYTVGETDGLVRVSVVVLEGSDVLINSVVDMVQVQLDTEMDTALGSDDFTPTSSILEFSSSVTQVEVQIPIVDDDIYEEMEQFFARLTVLTTGADVLLSPDVATITILDNDEILEVQLEVLNPTVAESSGEVIVVITASRSFSEVIPFIITLADVTANSGADYDGATIEGVVETGVTVTDVTVTIFDDDIEELDVESFRLSLALFDPPAGVQLGASQEGVVSIIDDDRVVIGFEAAQYIVRKPARNVTVSVVVLFGGLSRDVEVTLATADDSALDPGDYMSTTQILTFGPGRANGVNVLIRIVDDTVNEGIEQFFARLSVTDPSTDIDVDLNPDETVIEIIDNDFVQIGFESNLYTVEEGAGEVVVCVVVVSGSLSDEVVVSLNTQDNTAIAAVDYTSITDELLTFSPSVTRQNVSITLNDDGINENIENFLASLAFQGDVRNTIRLLPDQATIQIMDDDDVRIGFRDILYSTNESGGVVVVSVGVLSGALSGDISVRLSTREDSATAVDDFRPTTELLVFSADTTQRDVSITITDDRVNEPLEEFFLALEFVSVGVDESIQLNPDMAVIRITDNDDVQIGFDREFYSVNESNGRVTLGIAVLVGQLSDNVVIQLSTQDNTAQAPDDYTALSDRLLTFSGTNTRGTVDIIIAEDGVHESMEDFLASLTFSGVVSSSVELVPAQATVQIVDNDRVVIGFSQFFYFVDESSGEVVVCVAVLSGALSSDVSVQFTTTDGTATAPGDYVTTTQLLVFGPAVTQINVSLPIADDDVNEAVEQFMVELVFDGDSSIVLAPSTAVVMIVDDDAVVIGFEQTVYTVEEGSGPATVSMAVLSGQLSSNVIVRLDTTQRSAEVPDDFEAVVEFLIFNSEVTSLQVPILVTDDDRSEPQEEFVANLTLITTGLAVEIIPDFATVIINDNDAPEPVFEFSVYSVPEDNRSTPLCVDVGAQVSEDTTYTITAIHKDPPQAEGADFGTSVSVTVSAFSSRACIDFTDLVVDDDIALEGDQAFTIVVGNSMAMVTIIDDDDVQVSFIPASYMVSEGGARNLTVVLSAIAETPVELLLSTSGISASGGMDYTELINVPVIFSPGVTTQSVTLTTLSDTPAEGVETLGVTLTVSDNNIDPSRIEIVVSEATVTITEDVVPELSFTSETVTVSESEATVQVCLVLSVPLTTTLTVPLTLSNSGSATAGVDFNVVDFEVTFPQEALESCAVIEIVDDSLALEGEETFTVSFITPAAVQQDSPISTTVTIIDNDEFIISFTEVVYRFAEGESSAEVCLEGVGEITQETTATLSSLAVGTATEGQDYFAVVLEEVVFLPGVPNSQQVCLQLAILSDGIAEREEYFMVVIRSVSQGSTIGTLNTTSIFIIDNDVVTVQFEEPQYRVEEGGVVEVCLLAEGAFDFTFTVLVDMNDITAHAVTDYENRTVQVEFVSGVQRQCFTIATSPDDRAELVEIFSVNISSTSDSSVVVVSPSSSVIEILDDDEVVVQLEEAAYTVSEGASLEVCAVIIGDSDSTVTADLLATEGSALADEDYSKPSGADFTFHPPATRSCVTVNIIDDDIEEPDEMFSVFLSNPSSLVTVTVGLPNTADVIIRDNDAVPPSRVVCEISSPMQVASFTRDSMYSFSGVCDHWLVAPSIASNGVVFSVTVNFLQEDLRLGRVLIRYGGLELVSTAEGCAEANVSPINSTANVFEFSGNVVAVKEDGVTSVELRDIGVTVTHTYSPLDLENVQITIEDSAKLPGVAGLCGTGDGRLVFGGGGGMGEVTDMSSLVQLQRFSRSWIVPPNLQTSSVPSCSALQMNDTIIADPQFSVTMTSDPSEALCYEVHGRVGGYFNLISDACLSVNTQFTPMPNPANGNRMSCIGIHTVHSEEPVTLGGSLGSRCIDISIELQDCAAFINGAPVLEEVGSIGEVRYRKHQYKGHPQWRVAVPNCEREVVIMRVTCQTDMLRLDVKRNPHTNPSSHGLLGQFWDVPITTNTTDDGEAYVDIHETDPPSDRHIPARKFSLTWDHYHQTCYYVGNSQGGPERSRNQEESVIEGSYKDYETSGLFATGFLYEKFEDGICET